MSLRGVTRMSGTINVAWTSVQDVPIAASVRDLDELYDDCAQRVRRWL